MSSYVLVGSSSIVQILGPNTSADMVSATIRTQPTGIVATTLVSQVAFDDGSAGPALTSFADAIETIIGQGKAVGGSGTSSLDASGLMSYFVTFEVAYSPAGAPTGTVTVDVDVSVGLLDTSDAEIGRTLMGEAEALINAAYDNLVALSQG
jgi:hypothetical protein